MTTKQQKTKFTVIANDDMTKEIKQSLSIESEQSYHTNPLYQKLLQFRHLQEQQKKKFSVDDLFRLC